MHENEGKFVNRDECNEDLEISTQSFMSISQNIAFFSKLEIELKRMVQVGKSPIQEPCWRLSYYVLYMYMLVSCQLKLYEDTLKQKYTF